MTTSLTLATVGEPYQFQLTASGGGQPYAWSLASGRFPQGMLLETSTGRITGTPAAPGNFSFTAEVQDSGIAQQQISNQTLTLAVGVAPLQIVTPALPGAVMDAPYSLQMQATGGVPPYLWSVDSGALPPGLTLDALTGKITGTAIESGTFSVTIQVADSSSPQSFARVSLGPIPNGDLSSYISR